MAVALTIAGFDPSSGAGITADLSVFAAHGLFGVSAITALTVQSTTGVRSVHPVERTLLQETLGELEDDLPADGIKIGMLGTSACVEVVSDFIERVQSVRRPIIVLDPVLRSSSERTLLDAAGVELLCNRLLPLIDWATPNVEELAVLNGETTVPSRENVAVTARTLRARYPTLGLIVTGGHMEPPDDFVLMPSGEEIWLPGERLETSATHGTGCAFSSAFLGFLVQGRDAGTAAREAKHFVAEAMRRAVPRGRGRGPMNLLWPLHV